MSNKSEHLRDYSLMLEKKEKIIHHVYMKKKSLVNKQFKNLEKFRLHHKIFFSLVGIIGVIAVWRGIWNFLDYTPIINDPATSIIFGFVLIIVSGVFFKLL